MSTNTTSSGDNPDKSVDEIRTRADELAAQFESEDFDGDRLSPEEYERLRARIKPPRDV